MARYYKLEIGKWNNGTDNLELEEEAAYLRIVNQIRLTEEPISDNLKTLGGHWRCGNIKAAKLRRALIEKGKIEIVDGLIYEDRSVREARAFTEYTERQREHGKKGGRPPKEEREPESPVPPAPPEPEPEPEPDHAPDPEPAPDSQPVEDTTERERLLIAMGHNKSGVTATGKHVGGQADMLQFHKWRDEIGLTMDEIEGVVREVVSGKGDGPPSSFRYFTGAMQRYAAEKEEASKPLPKAQSSGSGRSAAPPGSTVKRFPGPQLPHERKKAAR